jgi:hypothetical protein
MNLNRRRIKKLNQILRMRRFADGNQLTPMKDEYLVYPDAGDGLWCPTSPEPLTLEEALQSVRNYTRLMQSQGYWRDSRGQSVPYSQVRFVIEHADYDQ